MLPADLKVLPGRDPESYLQRRTCTRRAECITLTSDAYHNRIFALRPALRGRRLAMASATDCAKFTIQRGPLEKSRDVLKLADSTGFYVQLPIVLREKSSLEE
jgi:hypothetical protein